MAVSSLALVTTAEAKAFLKKTDDADLTVLEQIIDGVSALFNRITERTLASQTYTEEKYDSNGWPDLFLPNRPVTALGPVVEDGATLAEGTDFYAYLAEGRLRRAGPAEGGTEAAWTAKPQAISVTYTAGFTAAAMPADLKMACLIQAADLWQKFQHKSWGETTRSVAGQSVTVQENDLLEVVATVLKRYKRRSI